MVGSLEIFPKNVEVYDYAINAKAWSLSLSIFEGDDLKFGKIIDFDGVISYKFSDEIFSVFDENFEANSLSVVENSSWLSQFENDFSFHPGMKKRYHFYIRILGVGVINIVASDYCIKSI